jgi:hypothetical protein
VGEQRTAHATTAQEAAADQKAQHAALAAFAFVVVTRFREFAALVLVLVLDFILASGFRALLQEFGEKRVADSTAAQYPAADDETQELAMIAAALFALVGVVVDVLVFVFEFIRGATVLAHEVCEQQAADAGATQQAARDQEFQQAMLLIAAFLVVCTANLFVADLVATTLAKQACKKQSPHAPAAQHAASNQKLFGITHDTYSIN